MEFLLTHMGESEGWWRSPRRQECKKGKMKKQKQLYSCQEGECIYMCLWFVGGIFQSVFDNLL